MRNGVVPDHWADFYESTRIPAAVRDGDRLYVTGHTGEDPDGNFSADPFVTSVPRCRRAERVGPMWWNSTRITSDFTLRPKSSSP